MIKNIVVSLVILVFINGCVTRDNNLVENNNILCVEIDEIGNDDNEALKKPDGKYLLIKTNPLNFQSSLYRYKIDKEQFNFFCSAQSNWSFKKVGLKRIYTHNFGLKKIEYKLRRVFHHNPDGAELLITSTWFLTDKMPNTNNIEEINIIKSQNFFEQVNRLRNLEQATFCLQSALIMNEAQKYICNEVLKEFKNKYSNYENEIREDAQFIQDQNI